MNRERLLQILIFFGLIFAILLSFLIGILAGEFYMTLFFIIIFCGGIFVLIELYLRIQHNIGRKFGNFFKTKNEISEMKKGFDDKFDNLNKVLKELVDFNEALLQYLEDEKEEVSDKLNNALNEFRGQISEMKELQNKIVVLMEQTLDYQKEQTNFLKDKIDKLKNGSRTRK